MLWIGEPGSLVGPWAVPAERLGDRLGRSRDDLRSGRLMNAAAPVIETLGLAKDFGSTRALDGLVLGPHPRTEPIRTHRDIAVLRLPAEARRAGSRHGSV